MSRLHNSAVDPKDAKYRHFHSNPICGIFNTDSTRRLTLLGKAIMIFFLSIIPSALVTAAYTYLVLYKDATFKTRAVQTVLRFAISFACYTIFYFASILALGAIYLAFDWYSGSNTAFRIQFIAISLIASFSSIFVATRRF